VTPLDAAYALDEFSADRTPDRGRLLAGVRALDEVRVEDTASVRDFLDAAAEGARLMHPLAINSALPS
jgi:hypothetical protein